jgi:hypothetical protein
VNTDLILNMWRVAFRHAARFGFPNLKVLESVGCARRILSGLEVFYVKGLGGNAVGQGTCQRWSYKIMNQITKILRLSVLLKREEKLPFRAPAIVRFAKNIEVDSETGCWNWSASLNNAGYGNFNRTSAHRFIYEFVFGSISDNLQIDHLCRNRRCANPNHLEMVTASENIWRGWWHVLNAVKKDAHH